MQEYRPKLRSRSQQGIFVLLLIMIAIFFQISCGSNTSQPDVSNIRVDLNTRRLDQDLARLDTNQLGKGLQDLKQRYPDFLDFYLDTLMGFGVQGNYSDTAAALRLGLRPFLTHKDIRGLFDSVQAHFPDTKEIEEKLTAGFRYMKHYYPSFTPPKLIYFISGLNQWSVMTIDTTILGIGLDMYLGPAYPFYHAVQIPQYVIDKCRPAYLPVNVFQTIYRNMHPFVMEERTLLDMMVQRGKEQYFLGRMLPDTHDTLRLGFTSAQLDWCRANEGSVYNFFITKNLLYETSVTKVLRYVTDGPTATGMPAESPGNIGSWLGYRIVSEYMKQQPDMTMDQMFAQQDAQRLLQQSRYKPK